MPPRITAVLVLYRMRLDQSACFQSLRDALRKRADSVLSLMIYDNSPSSGDPYSPSEPPALPFPLIYRHDPANGGVAAAYNAGLAEARANGSEWLLLLDQDTALTGEYLDELGPLAGSVPAEVVAIVPRLVQDGQTHSPQQLPRLSHQLLQESSGGILRQKVSAFNSGAAIRVSAMKQFPVRYWLDFLDHAVFHELQAGGGRIWLMDARLEHRLSTQRLGDEASVERYLNVLQAERDFYRQYGSVSDKAYYRLRRVKQTAGQLLKVPDKRFALLSARAALGLLPTTPERRANPGA